MRRTLLAIPCLLTLACAGPGPTTPPTPPEPPGEARAASPPKIVKLPGVTVNMTERYVEMEGSICLREGLLELIATVPAGKEHESIVSLKTRSSGLHAALLMLGLEPGAPGRWIYHADRVETVDPTGDRVRVTMGWERDGAWVEKPIEAFVVGRDGREHLPGSEFVFAGSRLVEPRGGGEPVYLADQTGDVIALVSFDAEVLSWPTAVSDSNDALFWMADPSAIPELGTPVKLRVYPVEKKPGS